MESYTQHEKYRLLSLLIRKLVITCGRERKSLISVTRQKLSKIEHIYKYADAGGVSDRPGLQDIYDLVNELLPADGDFSTDLKDLLWWLHDTKQNHESPYGEWSRRKPTALELKKGLLFEKLESVLEISGINRPGPIPTGANSLRRKESVKLFGSSEQDRLSSDFELLALEGLPGQRLLYTGLPTYLALGSRPSSECSVSPTGHGLEILPRGVANTAIVECLRRLQVARRANFEERMRKAMSRKTPPVVERAIHSVKDIHDYLRNGGANPLEHSVRQQHINNLIDLLKESRGTYQVRLELDSPGMEFIAKAAGRVCITGIWHDHSKRENTEAPNLEGVVGWQAIRASHYVFWYGECPALRFLLDFERRWQALCMQSDDVVVGTLEGLVEGGEKGKEAVEKLTALTGSHQQRNSGKRSTPAVADRQTQEEEVKKRLEQWSEGYWHADDVPAKDLAAFMRLADAGQFK